MLIHAGLLLLGAIGFLISLYFTLVDRRVIRPDVNFIPQFCRMDEGTCGIILHKPEARLFKVPNSLLGMFYYGAIGLAGIVPSILTDISAHQVYILTSLFTVIVSVYLAYALLVKLRTYCVLCFTSHVLNLGIFLLLIPRTSS